MQYSIALQCSCLFLYRMKTFLKSNKTTFRHPCSRFLASTLFTLFFFNNCRQIQHWNPITFSISLANVTVWVHTKWNLLVSPLSTKRVNIFRLYTFFFFSVVAQFAHATCHDAGSDVTTTHTHSPTKENEHKHLEHRRYVARYSSSCATTFYR